MTILIIIGRILEINLKKFESQTALRLEICDSKHYLEPILASIWGKIP